MNGLTHIKFFILFKVIFIFFGCFYIPNAYATDRIVNLTIAYKTVTFAGKPRTALAINNQIPAPTLHFKEGDHVTINVFNRLNQETAIHWHGLLVPWQMDGVLGVSQQGIPPGGVFHYQFTLHQAGTYWYHSHAGLQEQEGLYGAIIIDPQKSSSYQYTKDYVIVLSDWINTQASQVLANLKKEGDYYSPNFPLQPSLKKFIADYFKAQTHERTKLLADYQAMQQMRMSFYDLSDVAYDAFLLNGQTNKNPWTAPVKKGDVVRLRFIGATAGTIFRVKVPEAAMQLVHVDGNDIKPRTIHDFSISPGETYDVLVRIEKNIPYVIYAESTDKVGAVYGTLVPALAPNIVRNPVQPFPEPLPVTREMMTLMMAPKIKITTPMLTTQARDHQQHGHQHQAHQSPTRTTMQSHAAMSSMQHTMHMPTESTIIGDKIAAPLANAVYETTSNTKYQNLIAAVKTNDPDKPLAGVINMELFGYMDRFIWFINGVPEYQAKPIILEPAKRYRVIFTNTSMMHHPMHIHGHWFILRKGNGAYDPLLHTIDVPPGATITADIDTDASGQWFFHCHMLYHMMTGMGRVFQYSTLIEINHGQMAPQKVVKSTGLINRPIVRVDEVRPIDKAMVHHPMGHLPGFWWASFIDIGVNPYQKIQQLTFKGLYGPDYNKLELFINDAESNKGTVENADIDIFYWHLLNQFWAIKGGINYFYRPALVPYLQPGIGLEGLLPYFIDTDIRAYYFRGSTKLDVELSRATQLTNNFFVKLGIRSILASKTNTRAQLGSGLNQVRYIVSPFYRLQPGLTIFAEYEHQRNYGAFRNLQIQQGEPSTQNSLTFGLSLVL